MSNAISPAQCRAARELLGWTREHLSEVSGIPLRTLADFESANTKPRAITLTKLSEAFGQAGIAFVAVHGTVGGAVLIR